MATTDRPHVPFLRHQRTGLLPCPLCGGPGELAVVDGDGDGGDHLAACAAENACPVYAVAGPYATAAEAAAAWNKRA